MSPCPFLDVYSLALSHCRVKIGLAAVLVLASNKDGEVVVEMVTPPFLFKD